MPKYTKSWRELLLILLAISALLVWKVVGAEEQSNLLHVYFLDIGQGDSIFIDSPTHGQVLIDGGPDRKILSELGKIMAFGDRSIDVVIESHPDADHITGLVDVLKNYDVGAFIKPGVESQNKVHLALDTEVSEKQIPELLARRGMELDLGGGAKLDVLFPNQDVTNWETNDASIVAKLTYGKESFLLTGDSTKKAESILLNLNSDQLESTVLKAGHHGSKNSTSLAYAEAVKPLYAVISAGLNNRYGHPSSEALKVLKGVGAQILSTESAGGLTGQGTIEFETDGETLVLK